MGTVAWRSALRSFWSDNAKARIWPAFPPVQPVLRGGSSVELHKVDGVAGDSGRSQVELAHLLGPCPGRLGANSRNRVVIQMPTTCFLPVWYAPAVVPPALWWSNFGARLPGAFDFSRFRRVWWQRREIAKVAVGSVGGVLDCLALGNQLDGVNADDAKYLAFRLRLSRKESAVVSGRANDPRRRRFDFVEAPAMEQR